ncbi:hypothetical protein HL658_21100 [Azospirillum sp. RWY-5-1]|uniref:Uncharacterized protein n=1 Tax=Azospirillum oleiclasticum TaxID=2735135 RepID=A0ABX2TFK2_9PROT|nr:hypothetical protein [Azospirillum oleiclasticum]NYZ15050.1 hypothetical protein [Azospirillum oleiclasticum]NYZ22812.1 hypothetical protein [Azospirillum oleiclasticum]
MGGWLWRRRDEAADDLVGMLGAGAVPAVLGLARRVEWPVRAGRALRLVAVAGLSEREAAGIGALGLHRRFHQGAGREERFVRAVVALDRQRRRNRADPRFWTEAERFGLFDPQGLTLACSHDRVLAALADRVRAEAWAVLRGAGDDPALLALRAWGVRRAAPTIHCG